MNNNSNFFTVVLALWSVLISQFGARNYVIEIYTLLGFSTTIVYAVLGFFGILSLDVFFFLFCKK